MINFEVFPLCVNDFTPKWSENEMTFGVKAGEKLQKSGKDAGWGHWGVGVKGSAVTNQNQILQLSPVRKGVLPPIKERALRGKI